MRGLMARLRSFVHAVRGMRLLFDQPNARLHLIAAILVVALGIALRITAGDWAALALSIALVLALEAVNTAIERVVDLASPHWHALARDAKDLAAGAVLIAAAGAVAVGIAVFAPYVLALP